MNIDITHDFRSDAAGRDPDKFSPTLRRYHQQLWSKPVPNGVLFDLAITRPGAYLHHSSEVGEFTLSSDSVIPTYEYWKTPPLYFAQIPLAEQEEFARISYTMGGMIIFPRNPIAGKWTINQARGTNKSTIGDRFDLTLECIRRHYLSREDSPLAQTLARYADFFALFGDFHGYVDFFLLQDLVTDDLASIRFFTAFADFASPAVPQTLDEFVQYRKLSVEFVEARNRRVANSA
ncbi:hypothetical protein [Cryobacterium sp. TMT2-14]|uniref:DUF6994 family protein n=1 Tax=Cryobacterium sp. TMT2-14 TaxID=1259245 RepID=UPI00106914D9|nr:hypothetical protein [Cryobacterium sp. TMT2-14]TFC34889.1 hypothetical protein E3O28_10785 [Cryobacterium sp. TMT2-14]